MEKSLAESLATEIYNLRIGELKRNYSVSDKSRRNSSKRSSAKAKRPKYDFLKKNKAIKGSDGLIHVKGDKNHSKPDFNKDMVLDAKMFAERAKEQAESNCITIQKNNSKTFTLIFDYDKEQKEWKGVERYSVSPLGGVNYGHEQTFKIDDMKITINGDGNGYRINRQAPKADLLIRRGIAQWAMNNGLSIRVESAEEEDE